MFNSTTHLSYQTKPSLAEEENQQNENFWSYFMKECRYTELIFILAAIYSFMRIH